MKTKKRALLNSAPYYVEGLERKLQKYAQRGLILKGVGNFFYKFEKSEPQDIKYAVVFSNEGSIYNHQLTKAQRELFEFAAEAGWEYVGEHNKMQVFSSALENPPPFESDGEQQLKNIHTAMKKTFILSNIILAICWAINVVLRMSIILNSPTEYLSDSVTLLSFTSMLLFIIIFGGELIDYLQWYSASKRSVKNGGGVIKKRSRWRYITEAVSFLLLIAIVAYQFVLMSETTTTALFIIATAQVPIFLIVYGSAINLLRKLKVSPKTNKIVSFCTLLATAFLYSATLFFLVARFDFTVPEQKPHTVVQWEQQGRSYDYPLYSDYLPLTCQDLYGQIDYENYSYEHQIEQSLLMRREIFRQSTPPDGVEVSELEYFAFTSFFDWVDKLIIDELLTIPEWSDRGVASIDNALFGAKQAYAFYLESDRDREYIGQYILIYDDKIIELRAGEALTNQQMQIVAQKLR